MPQEHRSENQRDEPQQILIATCRAQPDSSNEHNHTPLPAGKYAFILTERRAASAKPQCGCYTCANSERYRIIREEPAPQGDIILVIHGFNCTEDSGADTALNIRQALRAWKFPPDSAARHEKKLYPTVVGFTWPCMHDLFPGYISDKESVARFASFSLANVLWDLRKAEPERKIHIIAHSMGCFLVVKALMSLGILHGLTEQCPIVDTVMMLAPDVNASALERSTPDFISLARRGFRRRGKAFFSLKYRFSRPITAPAATHPTIEFSPLNHPIDGFGYEALDAIKQLHIFNSFNDEALWISPLANMLTEESISADSHVRLGWCGPLRPQYLLQTERERPRDIRLYDCSAIIYEHGQYFFHPDIQRVIAAILTESQNIPGATQYPNSLTSLQSWLAGTPLQYPPNPAEPIPEGLRFYSFVSNVPQNQIIPTAEHGAPTQNPNVMLKLWGSPFRFILRFWVYILQKIFRLG